MRTRICVIGAGRWGRNHIRTLAEQDALAGVVETDAAARAEIGEAHPEARCLASLDEALAGDFDGFVVASPAETHAHLADRVLEAGKPVLVEKPLALDVASAVLPRGDPTLAGVGQTRWTVGAYVITGGVNAESGRLLAESSNGSVPS